MCERCGMHDYVVNVRSSATTPSPLTHTAILHGKTFLVNDRSASYRKNSASLIIRHPFTQMGKIVSNFGKGIPSLVPVPRLYITEPGYVRG